MRVTPEEWRALPLRIHSLAEGVPLHDVWCVDLPGGPRGLGLADLRAVVSERRLLANPAVRFLFRLRSALGRVFGWDRDRGSLPRSSFFRDRLTEAERRESLASPGSADGPFRVVYTFPRESTSEVQNATVHALSTHALVERQDGYRLYWAIYVRRVSWLTAPYMALIDPFRHWIIYPALLRSIHSAWLRDFARVA